MRFIWHEALWTLLSVPVLIGAYEWVVRRTGANETILQTNLSMVREADRASQWMRRRVPPLLLLLGVIALLLATARPTAVFLVPAHRGTVVMAIDVSFSMAATDVKPTRLAAAQAAVAEFVEQVPTGVRIGLVAFGGYAELIRSPTTDKAEVLSALRELRLQQYTAIGTGMLAALLTIRPTATVDPKYDLFSRIDNVPESWLENSRRDPLDATTEAARGSAQGIDPSSLIILVSDGRGTLGVPESKAAEILAEHGIRVYTIGVGTPYGGVAYIEGYPPVHADFEASSLELVADITRAEYFHASNPEKLKRIYASLSREAIRELAEAEVAAALVALGAALLLLSGCLSLAWHGRPSAPWVRWHEARRAIVHATKAAFTRFVGS